MLCVYVHAYVSSIVCVTLLSYLLTLKLILIALGNTGTETDRHVQRDLINLRTFHMEFDI
jgi:hypothetical protein